MEALNSPRRIAVVILATLAGWALQHFAALDGALLIALLLGMLAANFVPSGPCAVPPRRN